jgi:hypothetical protein
MTTMKRIRWAWTGALNFDWTMAFQGLPPQKKGARRLALGPFLCAHT